MADVKKPDAKKVDKPAPKKEDPFVEIVTWIVIFMIAMYLLNGFVNMFGSGGLFSGGWKGLTPKGIILAHTRPIASLANPIGTRVISTTDNTSVYDSPGGKKIGSQPFRSRGKILQGSVTIGNDVFWYVDYDSGQDGWVNEKDIGYIESEPSSAEKLILWFWSSFTYFKFISIFLSILLVFWIAYIILRLTDVRKNRRALLYPNIEKAESETNPKWEGILAHVESLNENDWKLAIIEADIMLGDILEKMSLPGDTMGEKMKAVEKSDFTTIDLAWEAHKIRNQIAHEGSDYLLSSREARRVIALYQAIFEEFQII